VSIEAYVNNHPHHVGPNVAGELGAHSSTAITCGARTIIARDSAEVLVDHDPSCSRRRSASPPACPRRTQRLVGEIDDDRPAAREIEEIERLMR
jgi:hypothetical protein